MTQRPGERASGPPSKRRTAPSGRHSAPPARAALPWVLGGAVAAAIGLWWVLSGSGTPSADATSPAPPRPRDAPPSRPDPPPQPADPLARLRDELDRARDFDQIAAVGRAARRLPRSVPRDELERAIEQRTGAWFDAEQARIEGLVRQANLAEATTALAALKSREIASRVDAVMALQLLVDRAKEAAARTDPPAQPVSAGSGAPEPPPKRSVPTEAPLSPAQVTAEIHRAAALAMDGREHEAIHAFATLMRRNPDFPYPIYYKALLQISTGDYENGTECLEKLAALIEGYSGNERAHWLSHYHFLRGDAARGVGDYPVALEQYRLSEKAIGKGKCQGLVGLLLAEGRFAEAHAEFERPGQYQPIKGRDNTVALHEMATYLEIKLGRIEGVERRISELRRLEPVTDSMTAADVLKMWACIELDGRYPGYTMAAARELNQRYLTRVTTYQHVVNCLWMSRAGQHRSAVLNFDHAFRAWYVGYPEFPFAHACSLLAMEDYERARDRFALACRMRPALRAEMAKVPGIERILRDVLADLDDLARASSAERIQALNDQVLRTRIGAADERVMGCQFERALIEYRQWLEGSTAQSQRARLTGRIARTEQYLVWFDRLIAHLNQGRVAGGQLGLRPGQVLGKVSRDGLMVTEAGVARQLAWGMVNIVALVELAATLELSPVECYSLGTFAFLYRLEPLAHALFQRAGRAHLDHATQFVADMRGIDPPPGGFVLHAGRFATADEAKRLSGGQVLFRGRWISADDKRKIEQGFERRDGQWVKLDEAELKAQGLALHEGRWLLPDEVERLGGAWAKARTRETAHFVLTSNRSSHFLEKLATLAESAYVQLESTLGAPYPGKIKLLAFKDRSEYRAYVGSFATPAHVEALAGTSMASSEEHTCCAWDRTNDSTRLCDELTGRVAEMYVRAVVPRAPAWLVSGARAYFAASDASKSPPGWGSSREAPIALRRAIRRRALLPWTAMGRGSYRPPSGRELELFDAQSWGLYAFLVRGVDAPLSERFRSWLAASRVGGSRGFDEFLGEDFDLLAVGAQFYVEDL